MAKRKQIALVTGSSRGIGLAIAYGLGKKGLKVLLNSTPGSFEELRRAAKFLSSKGIDTDAFLFDVGDGLEVKKAFDKIECKYGGVDVLINNAGIIKDCSFVKMSVKDWDDVMSVNLSGAYHCCKSVVPYMIAKKQGRIINVSSIVGQRGSYGQVNYAAAKAGLIGFTKALAREIGKSGVTVNAVAPGYINTRMLAGIPEEYLEEIVHMIPSRRLGEVEDVANVVVFLATNRAAYVNGAVINVDGGI